MNKMSAAALLAVTTILVGCSSTAPYSNETTARSLGKGNWSSQFGASTTTDAFGGVYLRQGYGVFDAWDVGIDAETTSRQGGLWTRYSFINPTNEGVAFALIGGAGVGQDSHSDKSTVYNIYAGPILSYKKSWFEGYTLLRANYLYSQDDINDPDTEFQEEYVYELLYGSYALGANFWVNHFFAVTADANILFKDDADEPVSRPYFNVGLLFRY